MDFDHVAWIDWQLMPAAVKQTIWAGAATIGAAWLGRLAWHTQLVRLGHRRFWSLELLWELVLATALGFVADGIADYLQVQGKAATALVIVVSYLGPRGVEQLLAKIAARYVPASGSAVKVEPAANGKERG